jgi:hypothetical protein
LDQGIPQALDLFWVYPSSHHHDFSMWQRLKPDEIATPFQICRRQYLDLIKKLDPGNEIIRRAIQVHEDYPQSTLIDKDDHLLNFVKGCASTQDYDASRRPKISPANLEKYYAATGRPDIQSIEEFLIYAQGEEQFHTRRCRQQALLVCACVCVMVCVIVCIEIFTDLEGSGYMR